MSGEQGGKAFEQRRKSLRWAEAMPISRGAPSRVAASAIGKPAIRAGLLDPWRNHIRELAELPNVSCKLSGVITEADHAHWTRAQLRPYVDHVIACFGFDRLLYASDWPVSDQTHRYLAWVAILDDLTAGCSETEVRNLFRDNAIAFYRARVATSEIAKPLIMAAFSGLFGLLAVQEPTATHVG